MPSEATSNEGLAAAVRAVQPRIDRMLGAVKAAEQEIRDELNNRVGAEQFRDEKALVELGPFGIGRIDPERFARLVGVAEPGLPSGAIDVIDRADAVLARMLDSSSSHVVRVPDGGDLRDVVKEALASFGQVFGAARAVELARAGSFDPDRHGELLGALPFHLWNRAERNLAPPIVVDVNGDDCRPAGLGEFLDGTVTLVLVARGPTTPAPLARLITPGTFVMQTADPDDLQRLAGAEYPGIALLFDEERPSQARFVHDPRAGEEPWSRLEVSHMPAEADVGRGRRPPLWLEDLAQLRMLATRPSGSGARAPDGAAGEGVGSIDAEARAPAMSGSGETAAEDPADRLAAWLLTRTRLDDA